MAARMQRDFFHGLLDRRPMSLWPPPRRVEVPDAADPLVLLPGAPVALHVTGAGAEPAEALEELEFALAGLRRALATTGQHVVSAGAGNGSGAGVACRVTVDSPGAESTPSVDVPTDESYCLRTGRDGIAIEAATPTGAFRAATTLKQWLNSRGRPAAAGFEVPAVQIEDRPDFPIRGAMLDVSRNRVPRMEYLERLVDRLADWKVNHLQLYVEHTYAYADHEEVWRDASPFTAGEIRELDACCRERFIELTPNQNSFGHFHRWLIHDRYRPLAEVPEGFQHPFSIDPEPFSLCATDPRVLDLLAGLYDELLPEFGSRRFHVGLDETFDLGRGRSAEACEERGKAAVYLDFLRQVHDLVTERDRQMLFWGDIILEHPEVIDQVPEDAVALCWGYEASHPFEDRCARLAASGREFWVCPGTSSWHSFGGRLQNAVGNLALAATAGSEAGAQGLLITDWGDHGHLQPPVIAELPLSIGAGFAWSVEAAREATSRPVRNEESWLDHAARLVYDGDETLARTVIDLGAIDLDCGGPVMNGTTLFYLLRFIDDDLSHRRFGRLSIGTLQRTYVRLAAIRDRLHQVESDPSHAALDWTCRMMTWCCQLGVARLAAGRGLRANQLAPKVRATLGADLRRIAGDLPDVWLATSREGGLRESQDLLLRAAAILDS
ncbi:MAG: family 20 glycosylhydrolase [Acidobacteria bacterium]|nr:family 20 glycosylhydrolase [Acidobacteriota bacterium]